MLSWWMVWIVVVLDKVVAGLQVIWVVGLTGTVVAAIGILFSILEQEAEVGRYARYWAKRLMIITVIAAMMWGIVPNSKQMAAIVVLPKMVNAIVGNKEMQKLPDNMVGLANDWMETMRKEIVDKGKEITTEVKK